MQFNCTSSILHNNPRAISHFNRYRTESATQPTARIVAKCSCHQFKIHSAQLTIIQTISTFAQRHVNIDGPHLTQSNVGQSIDGPMPKIRPLLYYGGLNMKRVGGRKKGSKNDSFWGCDKSRGNPERPLGHYVSFATAKSST